MIYNSIGFFILFFFILLLIFSFFIKKHKVYNIILPYDSNFLFLNIFEKILIWFIFFIIILIPFNIWIYQWTKVKKIPTLNIQILFDVSLSMTAKDFNPDRFYVAKNALVEFIKSLDTDYNIWLIAFSWKPFVYMPITDDKKAIISKISHMSMSDFPPTLDFVGTAIWDAILLWKKQLLDYTNNNKKPWVMILITDGDSNKWINPLEAINYDQNMPIFVWAIWNNPTYIVWKDIYGNDVPTSIDFNILREISEKTWWEFKRIENKEDFLDILSKLYSYVKNYEKIQKIQEYTYINFYLKIFFIFLVIIYIIFFVNFFFKKSKT